MSEKEVKTVSLRTFIIVILIIIIICAAIVFWALTRKPNPSANIKNVDISTNTSNTVVEANNTNEEKIMIQEYSLNETVRHESLSYKGEISEYFILKDSYKGEYDLQYLSFVSKPSMESEKSLSYEEYTNYCKEWNLNQKYNDSTKNYIVFSYISNGKLNAILGGISYEKDIVNLYIRDESEVGTTGISAYVIIVPTEKTVNKVNIISLYTEKEFESIKSNTEIINNSTTQQQDIIIDDYSDSDVVAKPIIYLYPKKETKISVKLLKSDNLICSYPKYKSVWNVIAKPNGDLKEITSGKKLYSLYYESKDEVGYKVEKEGFVIKGEDSSEFLEKSLKTLGLNYKEAEEFIVYWLPKLEANKYNYIRFASEDEIEKNMPLEVNPSPKTTIRVMMTFKGLEKPIKVKEQKLLKKERKGYTLVEWGGSEIK